MTRTAFSAIPNEIEKETVRKFAGFFLFGARTQEISGKLGKIYCQSVKPDRTRGSRNQTWQQLAEQTSSKLQAPRRATFSLFDAKLSNSIHSGGATETELVVSFSVFILFSFWRKAGKYVDAFNVGFFFVISVCWDMLRTTKRKHWKENQSGAFQLIKSSTEPNGIRSTPIEITRKPKEQGGEGGRGRSSCGSETN